MEHELFAIVLLPCTSGRFTTSVNMWEARNLRHTLALAGLTINLLKMVVSKIPMRTQIHVLCNDKYESLGGILVEGHNLTDRCLLPDAPASFDSLTNKASGGS
jgi:hypothetical protein